MHQLHHLGDDLPSQLLD